MPQKPAVPALPSGAISRLVAACCLACAFATGQLAAAPVQNNRIILGARGVTLPFYSGPENKLSLLVKWDHVTKESQRKGFFRIGVLPLMVAHDVRMEARSQEHFGPVIQEVHRHLAGRDLKNGVELRQFTLKVPQTEAALSARRVRVLSSQEWELTGGVELATASTTNRVRKALLLTEGEEAGTLRLEDGRKINLFATSSSPPRTE